uniref:Uncharacterized protein n=1 Tax=viral metagenome TaxID=1070528 RepID=A0A6C0I0R5_9ZZZZ
MSRIKIKSKVVKSTLQNKDVIDMFHGVIGTDGASISITHQKYNLLEKNVKRFLQVLEILHNVKFMDFFSTFKDNLDMYLFALRRQFTEAFSAPSIDEFLSNGDELVTKLNIVALDYSKVPIEIVNNFNSIYGELKKCSLINTIIVTCKNLIPHKKSIEDINELKDKFLLKGGLNFAPLPFLIFNFKQIYIDDRLSEDNKDFILTILHKLYTISHEVYDTLSSPDIDVNEFVTIIMSSIDDVKKQIPRCEQAFNKIAESVDLLKGNFNGYYKDYISSNNPTIIMENFVLDVSKNTRASPTLTAQFRKIIAHYRKIAAQQANNPKLQTLFQQVDKNFQELENQRKKADMENSDDEEEELEDDTPMTEEEMKAMEEGLNKVMENIKEKNPALSGMFDKLSADFGAADAAGDKSATPASEEASTSDAVDPKKLTKAEQKKLNQKNKVLAAKAERKIKADAAKARKNPISDEYVMVNAETTEEPIAEPVAETEVKPVADTVAETVAEATTAMTDTTTVTAEDTTTATTEAATTTATTEAAMTEATTAEDTTTATTEATTTEAATTEAATAKIIIEATITEAATTEAATTEAATEEATSATTEKIKLTKETKPKAAKKTKK